MSRLATMETRPVLVEILIKFHLLGISKVHLLRLGLALLGLLLGKRSAL